MHTFLRLASVLAFFGHAPTINAEPAPADLARDESTTALMSLPLSALAVPNAGSSSTDPETCAPSGIPCVRVIEDDLWIRDRSGERLLASGRPRGAGDDIGVTHIAAPTFSPDGSRLYISTDGWVVSNAVQEVNLTTGEVSLVSDGDLVGFTNDGALAVSRFLLDLDHDMSDPAYGGRQLYLFRIDPVTKQAQRVSDEG